MAQYAIAFDLDTTAMEADGLTKSEKTRIYQTELPNALKKCGFTVHPQGSLYHTKVDANDEKGALIAIMNLKSVLIENAANFCKYAANIHVFRMDEWSDVTEIITGRPSEAISVEEIIEQSELTSA
jgi:virulence-associated protein VapD